MSPSGLLFSCSTIPTGGLNHRQVVCRPAALKMFAQL